MDGLQPPQPNDLVKLLQHPVQVARNVVAAVGDVAGVQAHAQLVRKLHPVENGPQFLKAAAHLRALARHSLQQHRGGLLRRQNGVEVLRNQRDAHFRPLLHVAAGVEVVQAAGDVLQPGQVVGHGLPGEGAQALVGGAGVQGVGGVGQNGEEPLLLGEGPVGGHVLQIQGLGLAAPGIAGEELEGVGPNLYGFFPHGQVALGAGKMASYFQHGSFSFRGWQGSPAPFHCTGEIRRGQLCFQFLPQKKGPPLSTAAPFIMLAGFMRPPGTPPDSSAGPRPPPGSRCSWGGWCCPRSRRGCPNPGLWRWSPPRSR